jgi:ABC-type taurine transport system substrate-binding protein
MLTFRFLHRVTFQTIAIFLASTAVQAAEVVTLGVPNYFRDEGIELRLIRVNGARAVAALMSGDVHFDVLGATAITARYNGVPLKLISSTLDRPFSWVYARPNVDHVSELKGNSIAVTVFGTGPPFFLVRILKEHFGWTDPEREMKLSLDMSRQSLKTVRQELIPADMYDFAPMRKAKQELEAEGWTP